jgi:hypothetical protein
LLVDDMVDARWTITVAAWLFTGGQTVVDDIRRFPFRPDVRWAYRVPEQIRPAL